MTPESDSIFDAAMALPEGDRAELADRLLRSVHRPTGPEVEAAWAEEVERRIAGLDRGDAETIPWPKVRRKLRGIAHGRSE